MKHLTEQTAKRYLTTLQTDNEGKTFVKIYVDDYEELLYLQLAIIRAISYITEAHEQGYNKSEAIITIRELAELSEQLSPLAESELLTTLKNGQSGLKTSTGA